MKSRSRVRGMLAVLGPIPAKPEVHIRAEKKKKNTCADIFNRYRRLIPGCFSLCLNTTWNVSSFLRYLSSCCSSLQVTRMWNGHNRFIRNPLWQPENKTYLCSFPKLLQIHWVHHILYYKSGFIQQLKLWLIFPLKPADLYPLSIQPFGSIYFLSSV